MTLRGPVTLAPSRLARGLLLAGGPGVVLLLLAAALFARQAWPLAFLPAAVLVLVSAARGWDRVRGVDLRPAVVCLDLGDGRWRSVRLRGQPRLSRLALSIPVRREDDGVRMMLNIWRDAVDPATFRRLARLLRHGRWPQPVEAGISPRASGARHARRA